MDLCLSKMRGAADRLLSLINDVLDMSKIETGSIQLVEEPFDMIRLLNGTLAVQEVLLPKKSLTSEQDIEGSDRASMRLWQSELCSFYFSKYYK